MAVGFTYSQQGGRSGGHWVRVQPCSLLAGPIHRPSTHPVPTKHCWPPVGPPVRRGLQVKKRAGGTQGLRRGTGPQTTGENKEGAARADAAASRRPR